MPRAPRGEKRPADRLDRTGLRLAHSPFHLVTERRIEIARTAAVPWFESGWPR